MRISFGGVMDRSGSSHLAGHVAIGAGPGRSKRPETWTAVPEIPCSAVITGNSLFLSAVLRSISPRVFLILQMFVENLHQYGRSGTGNNRELSGKCRRRQRLMPRHNDIQPTMGKSGSGFSSVP
jgi:hypothetical protein